ncbi:MAG: peptidase, partial [Gemmatimonadetes bacterium]|nr:peptidase [Gemmatimonadota bacterium]
MITTRLRAAAALPLLLIAVQDAAAQSGVTTPEQQFGHPIGADYMLPDYTAFAGYWERLAGESDRMVLDTIGMTEEGRHQLMAIITSPENHRNLDRYRDISRRLALADGLTDDEARRLAAEGRAVVWIDGGLHATEVLGAQQLMETIYQLVSRTDDETLRILDDVIILAVHANPDGMELVSTWYMRNPDPMERRTGGLPRLYQKYVGHDNNRDFYASTQAETENMNRVMYTEWYPQIVYNHHQTGPA